MEPLKVSVVTVCWNCIDGIATTMDSIFKQTYGNIETVVVDGGSTDGTYEYLDSARHRLTVLISESDRGIYDAMNKGIRACTGDYIIFVNAGDRLASPDVVAKIMHNPKVAIQHPPIISGRIQFEYRGKMLNRFSPSKAGKEGPGLPHQATFVDAGLHKQNLYDDRLRSVADYELWQRLKKLGKFDVMYLPDVVSVFALGGRSNEIGRDSRRYLERAYVDSLYSNKFDLLDWTKLFFKVSARRIIHLVFGERLFYALLHAINFKRFERDI